MKRQVARVPPAVWPINNRWRALAFGIVISDGNKSGIKRYFLEVRALRALILVYVYRTGSRFASFAAHPLSHLFVCINNGAQVDRNPEETKRKWDRVALRLLCRSHLFVLGGVKNQTPTSTQHTQENKCTKHNQINSNSINSQVNYERLLKNEQI